MSECIGVHRDNLLKLLEERQRLEEEVRRYQAHYLSLNGDNLSVQVSSFHGKYGYSVRTVPQEGTREEFQFRLLRITEEYFEILQACGVEWIEEARDQVRKALLGCSFQEVDFSNFAGELGDLDYVVEGTRKTFGIPRQPIANEIHRANMEKLCARDFEGNPIKPSGWRPPDIRGILESKGWKENEKGKADG